VPVLEVKAAQRRGVKSGWRVKLLVKGNGPLEVNVVDQASKAPTDN